MQTTLFLLTDWKYIASVHWNYNPIKAVRSRASKQGHKTRKLKQLTKNK